MSGVFPEGSGDQPWPRWGSAFPLGSDLCFILRHSYHFLVQRRHFSNPQTKWVLEAQRRELRSTGGLPCQLLSLPCSRVLPCPFFMAKGVPPHPRQGGDFPPQHIACKIEKMQSPESSLLRVMRTLCFVQLLHIQMHRESSVQIELENLLLYSRNFVYLLHSGTRFSGDLKLTESWEYLLLEK